jgi:hypothetical protein
MGLTVRWKKKPARTVFDSSTVVDRDQGNFSRNFFRNSACLIPPFSKASGMLEDPSIKG